MIGILAQMAARLALAYQMRRPQLERALLAGGVAALAFSLSQSFPVYPAGWQIFLTALIFVAGYNSLTLGYFLAVAFMAWPLWQLSPYLATIFLAIVIIAHRPILRHLHWALLIAATPVFTNNLFAVIAPLAAGIFLGSIGGFWVGTFSALWLKIAASLSGLPTDLLAVFQHPILASNVAANFAQTNSVTTLEKFAGLVNKDPNLLLLDLTQVLGWGFAAMLVSWLWRRRWTETQPWLSLMTALLYGALFLWGSIFLLPVVLHPQSIGDNWIDSRNLLSLILSAALVGGLYALRHALSQPIQPARLRRSKPSAQPGPQAHSASASADRVPGGSSASEDASGDNILLEFD
jgi:hypothetical protein